MVSRMLANHSRRRWRWFLAWMAPGVCLAFGVTALGVFILPLGVVLVAVLARLRSTVDAWGALGGLGAIIAWIGIINLNYRACSSHAVHLSLATTAGGSASFSCGGVDGLTWLIVGGCAAGAAIAMYVLMTRSQLDGGEPASAPSLVG
jgi:hypothetical protein